MIAQEFQFFKNNQLNKTLQKQLKKQIKIRIMMHYDGFICCMLLYVKNLKGSIPTCYGVNFDAGSSGTRVYVYNWQCRQVQSIPLINEENQKEKKVKPGISSFVGDMIGLDKQILTLLQFAKDNVPIDMVIYTPIYFGATAGMRIIDQKDADIIIDRIRELIQGSGFFIGRPASVISGQEEGAYQWMSVNYLLETFNRENVLTIDLGGASTQISFKPQNNVIKEDNFDIIIPNLASYSIYTYSHLYYGINQAAIKIHEKLKQGNQIVSPCFHQGYNDVWSYDSAFTVVGQGDLQACQQIILKYFNKSDCNNCSINGVYQPIIDVKQLYGTDNIENMAYLLGIPQFNKDSYYQQLQLYTSQTWSETQQNPKYSKFTQTGIEYFQATYVYEILFNGYNIPPDANFNAPHLIDNITPSWTLGALFYQLSQVDCQFDSPVCLPTQSQT
ncbi:hypothetical protein pb186bvf_018686 [Paramecium bursaria]